MCLFNYLVVDYNYRSTDDQEGGELFLSSPVTFIAVVAIDFGTTFSGFAFAFNNKEGGKSIHMSKERGTDQGYSTMKTPTCLLLNLDQSFRGCHINTAIQQHYSLDEIKVLRTSALNQKS